MTIRAYLWGLRISTLFSFVAWLLVINFISPNSSGLLGLLFFYFSLALFSMGFFALMLFWLRKLFAKEELLTFYLGMSFRQGMLLSLLVIILLILQSQRILVWWDGMLAVAGIFLIELYFLFKQDE